jgi:ParB family chromosome partitioning protein
MLELAIVENLQREDLDPIEMAYSCKRMMDELGLTQDEVAKRLGKGRSTITNFMRLLRLPAIIQAELRDIHRNESLDENGDGAASVVFSVGHARALLNLPSEDDQIALYKKILKGGLSVRQTEAMAQSIKSPKAPPAKATVNPSLDALTKELGNYFSSNVNIQMKANGKGKILIDFTSDEDLQRIISKFNS